MNRNSRFSPSGGGCMFLRIVFFALCLCMAPPVFAEPAPAPASPPPDASSAPTATSTDITPAVPAESPEPASSTSTPSATASLPAPAPATYISPTWADLLRTMVRFGALDLQDDNLLDEYAAVTDCDIYKFYFKDDFKWNAIRKKIRDSADLKMTTYSAHYYFYTVLKLEHYDFDKKIYRFTPATTINNVNVFKLFGYPTQNYCDRHIRYIPAAFQAVTDVPFTLAGLPLAPADAQALLRQMEADKNVDHAVIVKFDMTITYIGRLLKLATGVGASSRQVKYSQTFDDSKGPIVLRLDARLDSVEFYEDVAMTKLVYSTKP